MPTDHWFTSLFQGTPELIALLLLFEKASPTQKPGGYEALGLALLDFRGAADLAAWLAEHSH